MAASPSFETGPSRALFPLELPPPVLPSHTSEKFNIHAYPPTELLKLLANFLTHTATTNDRLSPSFTSQSLKTAQDSPESVNPSPLWHTLMTGSQNALSDPASAWSFYGKRIPNISVEAYLLRIRKYCPTTNHVFLSLLVYFDRMSKLFEDAAGRPFVINSFNVYRLIITGYTVASKFLNDVFYTNSRYSKVGGIPLWKLNQLETRFVLLNDFQLVVSGTDLRHSAAKLRERADTCPCSVLHRRMLSPQAAADTSFQLPRSAIWLSINSATPLTRSSGRKRKHDTNAQPSPCPRRSPVSAAIAFKEFLKQRRHILSFSNPNANPIHFEIRKGMKSRRKAHHIHSTSDDSSSVLDTEGFLSSFASEGDAVHKQVP